MAIAPTTQQVARLMWWRTHARINGSIPGGELAGDFTDDTQPTASQALEAITFASGMLVDVTGPLQTDEAEWPVELDAAATAAIAYQAAADIEASMPNTNTAKLDWLQQRADALRVSLVAAIGQWRDSGETGLSDSVGSGEYVTDRWGSPWGYRLGYPWPFLPDHQTLGNRVFYTGPCDPRMGVF